MYSTSNGISLLVCFTIMACSHSGNPKKISGKQDHVAKTVVRKDIHDVGDGAGLDLQELYAVNRDAVFLIYTLDGEKYQQGSGFFITEDGTAVSNYHIFEGTYKGKKVIKLLSGKEHQIDEVITSNKESDFIVFKVKESTAEKFPFVTISNRPPAVGQLVFAIGNPKGLESTLSTGILSSLRKNENLIQTTVDITNGSSGGPLFDMKGDVIGITSSGMGEANLNFAIDIRVLKLK